jgi:hypothetical protein
MKNLKADQQNLIEKFVTEFQSFNAINGGENSLLAYVNEKINKDKEDRLIAKMKNSHAALMAETFLNHICSELQPLVNSFDLEVTKTYNGSGNHRFLYIDMPLTKSTLSIESTFSYESEGAFSYNIFQGVMINRTFAYRPNQVENITRSICDWLVANVRKNGQSAAV